MVDIRVKGVLRQSEDDWNWQNEIKQSHLLYMIVFIR